MGKGWAKGLTAATDPRVARAAEAHRGLAYERRKPIEECRWPSAGQRTLALAWSSSMAYLVGLTATDGCLYSGARKLNFKSSDRDLVATYLDLLGRTNRVKSTRTRSGGTVYFAEFGDAPLYRWFQSIGLSPRKSLTLGAIDVPDEHLLPLARGLLDGDGTIVNKTYRADTTRRPDYYWEYLITRFSSASRPHLEWLNSAIERGVGISGSITTVVRQPPDQRHPFFHLRYEKRASTALLPLLYPKGAPCLERKRGIWLRYAERLGLPTR